MLVVIVWLYSCFGDHMLFDVFVFILFVCGNSSESVGFVKVYHWDGKTLNWTLWLNKEEGAKIITPTGSLTDYIHLYSPFYHTYISINTYTWRICSQRYHQMFINTWKLLSTSTCVDGHNSFLFLGNISRLNWHDID